MEAGLGREWELCWFIASSHQQRWASHSVLLCPAYPVGHRHALTQLLLHGGLTPSLTSLAAVMVICAETVNTDKAWQIQLYCEITVEDICSVKQRKFYRKFYREIRWSPSRSCTYHSCSGPMFTSGLPIWSPTLSSWRLCLALGYPTYGTR